MNMVGRMKNFDYSSSLSEMISQMLDKDLESLREMAHRKGIELDDEASKTDIVGFLVVDILNKA